MVNSSERQELYHGFIDVSGIVRVRMKYSVARFVSIYLILALLLGSVPVAAGALQDSGVAIAVSQAGDGSTTVTVTLNESTTANVSVSVSSAENNTTYQGTGTYRTDENGTVELPAPERRVTVSITAITQEENTTTTASLLSGKEQLNRTFGSLVAGFIQELRGQTQTTLGPFVTDTVSAPNPSPPHAGPPTQDNNSDRRGPPTHAGPSETAVRSTRSVPVEIRR